MEESKSSIPSKAEHPKFKGEKFSNCGFMGEDDVNKEQRTLRRRYIL